jgi:hypothetical protein
MSEGGTGQKFTFATTVVSGVASIVATLMSVVYALQTHILIHAY